MGIEIKINSLEDMCDLMCYNKLPGRRKQMEHIKTLRSERDCYDCKHGYLGDHRLMWEGKPLNPCTECGKDDNHPLFEKREE